MIEYREIPQLELIDRVRTKYRVPMDQLRSQGFLELGFYTETAAWLGPTFSPLGLLGAFTLLTSEVSRLGDKLSVNGFHIAMVSREFSTYAVAHSLGVSFYTGFTDGTCLISSNFDGVQIDDEGQKLYKFSAPRPVQTAWSDHLDLVNKFLLEGKQVRDAISLVEYFSLLKRMDDHVQKYQAPSAAGSSCISVILSSIVSAGIIFSCVYLVVLIGGVVGSFYPACRFVRALNPAALRFDLLVILAGMGISWFLARFQNVLLTVEGIGTRLYARKAVNDSQDYISTKWLALPGVPLVPVRTYRVTPLTSIFRNRKPYILQPLPKMDWGQVKETIWRSKIGYAVVALLLFAFAVWSITRCR